MPAGPPLARGWPRVVAFVLFLGLDVLALGVLPLPERLTLAFRSAIAPGLGLFPESTGIAIALLLAAFVCTWAWFRWGISLPAFFVWWLGIVLTVRLFPAHTHTELAAAAAAPTHGGYVLAAHEFTWIMAVYVVVYSVGLLVQRLPFLNRLVALRRRSRPANERALLALPPVERARAVALWGIARDAGGAVPPESLLREAFGTPGMFRRARIISLLAHGRWSHAGDRDNAHLRAALILGDTDRRGSVAQAATLDARTSRLAVPASEPGWVGLLDGTLLTAALQLNGDAVAGARWAFVLDRWFGLHRGHRPGARHDFIGVTRERAPAWEHATATAIAAASGWCEPTTEWQALRRQVFGAIGRGGRTPNDNRLVAAGRCWAALMQDDEAETLLRRVTSSPRDPLAQALDSLAAALQANPAALRRVPQVAARSKGEGARKQSTRVPE